METAHQPLAGLDAGDALTHVEMQHGAAGVSSLQLVLLFQRLEGVVGIAHRQL